MIHLPVSIHKHMQVFIAGSTRFTSFFLPFKHCSFSSPHMCTYYIRPENSKDIRKGIIISSGKSYQGYQGCLVVS